MFTNNYCLGFECSRQYEYSSLKRYNNMERFIYELTENCPNGTRTFRYENTTREDAIRYARASCNPYSLTEIRQESSPAYAYPIHDPFSHKIIGRNAEPDWRTVSKEVILRHS